MPIRITPALHDAFAESLADARQNALRNNPDAADPVYLKIATAWPAATKRGILIEVTADELAELRSRTANELGPGGVCAENLGWSSDFTDRAYWMGRQRAFAALQRQLDVAEPVSS